MLSRFESWALQKNKLVIGLILVIASFSRIYLIFGKIHSINSDEAIIGIMARHIVNGAKPLFYYGQFYYGPLDAYLTAPLFAVFGSNNIVLRIVPVAASILFVYAIYILGKKAYSETTGLVAALFAAACPPFMLMRGVGGDAAYSLLLLLGTCGLILYEDIRVTPGVRKWIVLALLLLVGTWIFPLMLYYAAAIGLAWVVQWRSKAPRFIQGQRRAGILVAGGVVILLLIAAVLAMKIEAFYWVRAANSFSGILKLALPIMLGFSRTAIVGNSMKFYALSGNEAIQWLVALIGILILAACVKVELDRFPAGKYLLFLFASVTFLIYSTFFIFIGVTPKALRDPRFLFPLYSAIPLWVNALLQWTRGRPWIRLGAIALICLVNLYGLLQIPVLESAASKITAWYQAHPTNRMVYTDYWLGYVLAFESQEWMVPFIITETNHPGNNRYLPYQEQVSRAQHPSFLYATGSPGEADFRAFLKNKHIDYQAATIDLYTVYWDFSAPVSVQQEGLTTPQTLP